MRLLAIGVLALALSCIPVAEAEECTSNPPRPVTGEMPEPFCPGGTVLEWQNPNEPEGANTRHACLFVPEHAAADTPLPLVVFLHPSLTTSDAVHVTGLNGLHRTANVSDAPDRQGFVLLAPQGRHTRHFFPWPDHEGYGWDNWFRDPVANVDVQTIDHFIEEIVSSGIVDTDRIHLTGWSNGAAMAIWYTHIRPELVASTAVYSPPNPYGDFRDPCPVTDFSDLPEVPLLLINNDCDVAGICQTAQAMSRRFQGAGLPVHHVFIDTLTQPALGCIDACQRSPGLLPPEEEYQYPGAGLDWTLGLANHVRWPLNWTRALLDFFRAHPGP